MDRRYFLQLVGATAGIGTVPGIAKAAMNGQVSRPIIKIVGVGGAGGNIVSKLKSEGIDGIHEFICIDTDGEALNRCLADRKIVIGTGERLTKHHPTEAEKLAFAHREEIRSAVAGSDIVVVVAGLGGKTGTRMAPSVISRARRESACIIALLITPFPFEHKDNRHTDAGLLMAQSGAHYTFTISNAAIWDRLMGCSTLFPAYIASDRAAHNAIEMIISMARSGTISINDDISSIDQASAMNFCHMVEKEIVAKLPQLQEMLDESLACTDELNELDTRLAHALNLRLQHTDKSSEKKGASAEAWNLNLQRYKLLQRLRTLYETLDWMSSVTKALRSDLAWVSSHHEVAITIPLTKSNDLLAAVYEKVKELGQENSPVYGLEV